MCDICVDVAVKEGAEKNLQSAGIAHDGGSVIWGEPIRGGILKMSDAERTLGQMTVQGTVFSTRTMTTKKGRLLFIFDMTDGTACRLSCFEPRGAYY